MQQTNTQLYILNIFVLFYAVKVTLYSVIFLTINYMFDYVEAEMQHYIFSVLPNCY